MYHGRDSSRTMTAATTAAGGCLLLILGSSGIVMITALEMDTVPVTVVNNQTIVSSDTATLNDNYYVKKGNESNEVKSHASDTILSETNDIHATMNDASNVISVNHAASESTTEKSSTTTVETVSDTATATHNPPSLPAVPTIPPLTPHAWLVTASVLIPPRILGNPLTPDFGLQAPYVHWTCHQTNSYTTSTTTTARHNSNDALSCCQSMATLMWNMPELLCWQKNQCGSLVRKKAERAAYRKDPRGQRERNDFVRHCLSHIRSVPSSHSSSNDTQNIHLSSTAAPPTLPVWTLVQTPQSLPPLEDSCSDPSVPGARRFHQVLWASTAPATLPGSMHMATSPLFPAVDPFVHYRWSRPSSSMQADSVDSNAATQSSKTTTTTSMSLNTTLLDAKTARGRWNMEKTQQDWKAPWWFHNSLAWSVSLPYSLDNEPAATHTASPNPLVGQATILYFVPEDMSAQPLSSRRSKVNNVLACQSSCGGSCSLVWQPPHDKDEINKEGMSVMALTLTWHGEAVPTNSDADFTDGSMSASADAHTTASCTWTWHVPLYLEDEDQEEGVIPGPALLDAWLSNESSASNPHTWQWNGTSAWYPPIFSLEAMLKVISQAPNKHRKDEL
jgi:hypothetical protein